MIALSNPRLFCCLLMSGSLFVVLPIGGWLVDSANRESVRLNMFVLRAQTICFANVNYPSLWDL
jgi:hypothetical protein